MLIVLALDAWPAWGVYPYALAAGAYLALTVTAVSEARERKKER